MLSPAEHWKRLPTGRALRAKREEVWRAAEFSPKLQRLMVEMCKEDILFYLNMFAWTYNPKVDQQLKRRVVPFVAYPFQEKAIKKIVSNIDRQRDLVIEKSREIGGSWLCIYALQWLWRFEEWSESLLVSRNWDLVDGHTSHSLMWKLDFMHKWLPPWMMPKGWDESKNRLKGYLENPETGATITGQATTEKAGIGGIATAILFDEFSRVLRGYYRGYGIGAYV